MSRITLALLTLLALAAAREVRAVDGVIEINQAKALAGGVTPLDTPGWPVTLSLEGSYRLTGNLTVPANTTAISIINTHVTLDLNGFEIRGPNQCTGTPVTSCTTTNGNPGIVSANYGTVVRNGSVIGMGGDCIQLDESAMVERTSVIWCGGYGINVGPLSSVLLNHSSYNYLGGIIGQAPATTLIERNTARYNGGYGMIGGLLSKNIHVNNSSGIQGISVGDNQCGGVLC